MASRDWVMLAKNPDPRQNADADQHANRNTEE
jgi:hypothetical protein